MQREREGQRWREWETNVERVIGTKVERKRDKCGEK